MSGMLNPHMLAPTGTAYRYYGLLADGPSYAPDGGGHVFSFYSWMGYASADGTGADLFQGKTATATSGNASAPAGVDGNDATEFSSGPSASPVLYVVDMGVGNATAVHSFRFLGRDPWGGGNYAFPPTASFVGSHNGADWVTLATASWNNNGSLQGTYNIP